MHYAFELESDSAQLCHALIPRQGGRQPAMCKKVFPLVFLPLFLLLFPQRSPCAQPSAPFSATLVDFEGEVLIQKGGENLWLPVEKDMPLEQGDHIKTGAKGFAEILVDDGSQIRMEETHERIRGRPGKGVSKLGVQEQAARPSCSAQRKDALFHPTIRIPEKQEHGQAPGPAENHGKEESGSPGDAQEMEGDQDREIKPDEKT